MAAIEGITFKLLYLSLGYYVLKSNFLLFSSPLILGVVQEEFENCGGRDCPLVFVGKFGV